MTAAALRAAHGTVRCGRCGSAFDALPRLSDTLREDSDPGPELPVALPFTGTAGLTAAGGGLLTVGEGSGVPEFHFSADDIEQVFIDARDWQSRFGASSTPGDRAGRMGDTTSAELENLLQDPDAPAADGEAPDAAMPPLWVHEPESIEDITLEGERIEIEGFGSFEPDEDFLEREIENALEEQHRAEKSASGRYPALPDEPLAEATPSEDEFDDGLESTDRFEILRDVPESALPDDDDADLDEDLTDSKLPGIAAAAAAADDVPAVEPAAAEPAGAAVEAVTASPDVAVAAPAVTPISARWQRPMRRDATADDDFTFDHDHHRLADDLAQTASERRSAWAWGIGALLLAVVLAAQVTHHYRQQLVRNTTLGPALRQVYAQLGLPLAPNWNLGAFEVRQWGANEAAPSAAGSMTVRASLKNGATYAQPLPLLRLDLEDRFGGTVASRDFRPAEYLKDPAQATRLLPPDGATEAELAIVDAPADAVGYRLDVCMRDESGAVTCAQPTSPDPAAR